MRKLRRVKQFSLLWSVLVAVFLIAGHPKPGIADVSISVGVFIVDGFRYKIIGDAYSACVAASYTRCEIWDYNLINGESMNSLPWDPNGGSGFIPFDLHLGPGTLTICDTSCTNLPPFAIPRLSRVTGAGRTSSLAGGTVILAGSAFPTTGKTLVQIGDADASASFGSLLSGVTVDCNYVAGCTGIENTGGQEQSGLEHVNVVDYATKGIYIHGSGAQNSHYTDVEVNGCLSQPSCTNGTTPVIGSATVPLEIDNVPALRPIEGVTVNPVNTSNSSIQSITGSGGDIAFTVSSTGFVAALSTNYYITISGVLLSHTMGGATNFNGTYQITGTPSGSVFHLNIPGLSGSCPATCGGTASLVPTSDVVVCSGTTGCVDNSGNPTPVTFIGAHFENAGMGMDARGTQTALNLVGGSCAITGSTTTTGIYSDVSYCAFLEAGIQSAHLKNFYGGAASLFTLEDDNFTPHYQTQDKFIQLYDIGAASASNNANRTRHCSEPDCADLTAVVAESNSASQTPLLVAPGPSITQSADLFQVFTDSSHTTKTASVDASGNATLTGTSGSLTLNGGNIKAPSAVNLTLTPGNGSGNVSTIINAYGTGSVQLGSTTAAQFSSSGSLTNYKGASLVGNGIETEVYNTTSGSTNAGVPQTTMYTVGAADQTFRFGFYITQINTGSGCSSNPTVNANVIFTDPVGGATQPITFAFPNYTLSRTSSAGGRGDSTLTLRAKQSTTISYSTTYGSGGCTTNPSYQICPVLFAD